MNFQELIRKLDDYWIKQGCLIAQGYDHEVGAGTFHPLTFFKSLDKKPWRAAYVQPSRRPTDGRFADNPLRMQRYYQYQVLIKPAPKNIQDIYINSLKVLGINLLKHDLRFVEDDWESPTLGASGLGWEVWLDSLEITQFTYFQQMAGMKLDVVSVELTYGLERICMFLQKKKDLYKLDWAKGINYGSLHKKDEVDYSIYNFDAADIDMLLKLFSMYEEESKKILEKGIILPAYDYVLKMSHAFNTLDARGAISITSRPDFIARVRNLAKACASLYLGKKKK